MDELSRRFFNDPASYARAVELLAHYEKVEHLSWEKVEHYLSELDDAETEVLDKAIICRNEQRKTHQQLVGEVAALKQTVAALSAGLPVSVPVPSKNGVSQTPFRPSDQPGSSSALDDDLPLSLVSPAPCRVLSFNLQDFQLKFENSDAERTGGRL